MTDHDSNLRNELRGAQHRADGVAPSFDDVFATAQKRASRHQLASRRSGKHIAGLTAVAAVATMALIFIMPSDREMQFVDVDELMGSTTWSAPSDFLLPEHQFDIYREIPTLFESTEPDGGTLL